MSQRLLILLFIFGLIMLITRTCKGAQMPPGEAERLATAIYHAEGGAKARVPYGILSVKVAGIDEARRVCLNTIRNNWRRWDVAGRKGEYLVFLAAKYCPVGGADDGAGLNRNWLRNVRVQFPGNFR